MFLTYLTTRFYSDQTQKTLAFSAFFILVFGAFFCYLNGFSIMQSLLILLFLHIVSVVPIQFLLNKNSRWERNKAFGPYQYLTLFHPKMFKLFSIAIIYPYFSVLLLVFARTSVLGNSVEIHLSFELLLILLLLLILVIAQLHIVFEILLVLIVFKDYFWKQTSEFFFIIYLFLLQKDFFFNFMFKIHKYYFYFYRIVNLNSEVYWNFDKKKDFSFFRRLVSFIINNPIAYTYFLVFTFILELLISKQIYYFYYIFYIYFVLYLIWKTFFYLGNTTIQLDSCLSDYIYKNFEKPRFPYAFLFKVELPLGTFGFAIKLYSQDIMRLRHIFVRNCLLVLENKVMYNFLNKYNRVKKVFDKVNTNKYKLVFRISAYYRSYFVEYPYVYPEKNYKYT